MPNLVGMWRKSTMIETLNARFRHLVVFLIIAVFVAAVLRHVLHVYGSISREEIRTGSLLALFFSVSLYLTLLAIKRRRWAAHNALPIGPHVGPRLPRGPGTQTAAQYRTAEHRQASRRRWWRSSGCSGNRLQ
jgi:hypothetical protein